MYLEISGRRTGKTTRLVEEVYNCVLHYNSIAIIFAFNMHMGKILKREHFNSKYFDDNVQIFSTRDQYLRWIESQRGRKINKNIRLFYDEFDAKDDVILDSYGYYTTTPCKSVYKKHSTLARLIYLNGGTFIKKVNPELEIELRNNLGKDIIDKEIFANFSIYI